MQPGRHAPILRHFTLRRLLRVQATILRYLSSMIRINPTQKANLDLHLNPPNNTVPVDNWKLHLEPKSRNRTLQSRLQHVSILDCYGLCSSTPHFTSSESSSEDPDLVPVFLNVYDITPVNACLYWLGLGVHHSGVQVYGVEYAFGTDMEGTPQVFKMEPKNCEGLKFRKGILVGFSRLRAKEAKNMIIDLAEQFQRKNYHLITNNCNHFSTQACLKLTANSIPPWVNRLARIGSLFVKSGSWCRNKILAGNCKGKDAASNKNMKVLSRLMKFKGSISSSSSSSSSSSFSPVFSEVTFTGKSSRWKKSVAPL
ncbi:uncharacterized protein LOC141599938 [Silene latifolia]|uniref:uncharacterized protein LOC141599938 n=1 Tax=Silene latifolia TaxID=37657 RepID=UPI003D76B7F5